MLLWLQLMSCLLNIGSSLLQFATYYPWHGLVEIQVMSNLEILVIDVQGWQVQSQFWCFLGQNCLTSVMIVAELCFDRKKWFMEIVPAWK